jgi:nitroimidazol reductase NimA-like FMN-containing flavoprotein (pyridoxamine 5'-phosphate oxidase superfamily)
VAFLSEQGPAAMPVNFRMLDGDIVFRTAPDTFVAEGAEGPSVGFEVDHLDEALSEGWSVLVSGRTHPVIPAELPRVEELGIEPWAGGDRDLYLRLVPDQISGRSIRTQR